MDDELFGKKEMLAFGIVIGLIVGGGFVANQLSNKISELGQSICEEEHNMDYKEYYGKKLKCKPKIIANETIYDGIIIKVLE